MIAGQKPCASLKLHNGVEKDRKDIGNELLLVKEHIVNSWEREKVGVIFYYYFQFPSTTVNKIENQKAFMFSKKLKGANQERSWRR